MARVLLLIVLYSLAGDRKTTCRPHFIIRSVTSHFGAPSLVDGSVWVVGNQSINILVNVKQDIKSLGMSLRIDLSRGNRKFFTIINETKSYCGRTRFIKTNKIWEAIHMTVFNVTNFPQDCPIPKKQYNVNNYTFPNEILPAYMPKLSCVTEFKYISKNHFRENIVLLRFVLAGKILSK